jgi:hypothetical protein
MNRSAIIFVVGLASSLLFSSLASACEPRAVCLGIQWCTVDANGHEFAKPIRTAAGTGDGNGVGVDTAACQHKYGTKTQPIGWDNVSAGCKNDEYALIGKKALGGSSPSSCD